MGLSEVVDSSGKKANFSQTCSLLSQFLKEKGSFGELSLGLSQNLERKVVVPTGTMDLLPIIEKSGQNQAPQNPDLNPKNLTSPLNMFHHLVGGGGGGGRQETMKRSDNRNGTKLAAESAPLTIFYAGQVIVFNDFPADKANEIMMLASKSSAAAAQNHHLSASAPPQSPTESAASFPNVVPSLTVQELAHRTPPPPPPQFSSDLPIARKNSLARFLEKRKDRTSATEPYPTSKLAAPLKKAAENNEAWLRLGPQLPSQIRRN